MTWGTRVRELLQRAWWPWVVLLLLAAALRIVLWPHLTVDYVLHMRPWIEQVRAAGGLPAIGLPISNYTPPYLYVLAPASYLPGSPVTVMKAVALVADVMLAVSVGLLAAALRPGPRVGLAAATATLLLPSVVLDGALIGQFDGMYVAPTALALLFVLRGRAGWGCAMLGVAMAVKLQAILVAPVFVVLVLGRRLPARSLPWALVGWAGAMLPAVLAGRLVTDLPYLYTDQVGLFSALTLNAPNLYQWVLDPPLGATGALLLAAVVLGGLVLWLVRAGVAADDELVVRAAVLLLLVAPFVLPHMHERYTFAADALGVAYACVVRHGWIVALAGSAISAVAYLPFVLGVWMSLARLTGSELALVLLVASGLVGAINRRRAAAGSVPEPAFT